MANSISTFLQFFEQLQNLAQQQHCRFGVCIRGDNEFLHATIQQTLLHYGSKETVFQVGGDPQTGVTHVVANKGQQLLGRECQLLICDVRSEFDANSFSAALGTLRGGGILLVLDTDLRDENPATQWLQSSLSQLLSVTATTLPALPIVDSVAEETPLSQQAMAVEHIVRVVEGHRKRPLVLTADRGRGKSSALGIAAAQLMKSRPLTIMVTAPTIAAVAPVFQHAQRLLPDALVSRGELRFAHGVLKFIAPDDICAHLPDCDLLLVDEAAALPLPFLMTFVEHYHRIVFSSTIHGYEGCGRGFTLKFQDWLLRQRPQMRTLHLDQPIRWRSSDPLEAWHRHAFLLDYDLAELSSLVNVGELTMQSLPQKELLRQRQRLADIFSLLVNAHYQTSPNDLFQLLRDEAMTVFVASIGQQTVGCILAVREGELPPELIQHIQLGKRRPKGHLAPVTLANQLGIAEAAQQRCWRIMRIAVHPQLHSQGIGSHLLTQFMEGYPADYYATSFGATEELVNFWQRNHFRAVKIGSQRDQASGCYSLLMTYSNRAQWQERAAQQFFTHLCYELKDTLRLLEPVMVKRLIAQAAATNRTDMPIALLHHYAQGGANFESVGVWIEQLLLCLTPQQWQAVPELLVAKVLQQRTWQECANAYGLPGRKQTEQTIRQSIAKLLTNLQCKVTE